MLDVAWPELFVIGAVALVAIGPKDMPKAMHALGRFVRLSRAFFQEIGNRVDQLGFEAELAERMKKESEAAEKAASSSPPPSTSDPKPPEGQAHGG